MKYRVVVAVLASAVLLTGCTAPQAPSGAGSTGSPRSTSTGSATPRATTGTPTPGATPGGGASGGGGQTTAEACTVMTDALNSLNNANSAENLDKLQSDPGGAIAAIDAAIATVNDAAAKVSNADVKPAADAVAGASTSYANFLKSIATDPTSVDFTALGDQANAVFTSVSQLQQVCGTQG